MLRWGLFVNYAAWGHMYGGGVTLLNRRMFTGVFSECCVYLQSALIDNPKHKCGCKNPPTHIV